MLALLRTLGRGHLARAALRTLLVLTSIALGVAMAVAVQETAGSATEALTRAVEEAGGRAQLEIRAAGDTGLDEGLLAAVRATPGVAHASPLILVRAHLAGRPGRTLLVTALDLTDESTHELYGDVADDAIEDTVLFLARSDSLAIDEDFAAGVGLSLDDALPLVTRHGRRDFVVRGLIPKAGRGLAQTLAGDVGLMDLYAAQRAFGREGRIDRIDIALAPGADLAATMAGLASLVGAAAAVGPPATRGRVVEQMLASFGLLNAFLSLVALGATCFLIFGVTTVAVAERRREIAILRALGATRRQTVGLFIGEAALLGALASLLGVGIGVWIARTIPGALGGLVEEAFRVRLGIEPPAVEATALVRHFLVGLGATMLAALLAARRAAHMPIVAGLRAMPPPERERRDRRRRLLAAAALVGLSAAAVLAQRHMALFLLGGTADLLIFLAAFLAAPSLIAALTPWLIGPAQVVFGAPATLALRNVARQAERLAAPVVVLTIGLHLVTTVGAVAESFERGVLGWISQASALDLVVTASGTLVERTAAPLDASLGDALAEIPGVAAVRPIREVRVRVRGAEVGLRAWALGDPPTAREVRRFTFLAGRAEEAIPAIAAGTAVLVTQNLAGRLQLDAGEMLDLPTPGGSARYQIAGVVLDYLSQEGTVIVARSEYLRRWQDPLADGFGLALAAGAPVEQIQERIAEQFGARFDLVVLTMADYLAEARALIRRAFLPLRAIEVVTLAIGLLALMNALVVSVAERFHELGLLRASGASSRQLIAMILLEAMAATIVAALLGMASGFYGSQAWIRVNVPVATGWIVPYTFPLLTLVPALFAALGLGVAAAAFPARRAAHVSVVEALRVES